MAGFHFTKIPMFKIRGRRVVDEKLQVASMAPVLKPIVPPMVEAIGDVPSVLSSMNVLPVPVEDEGEGDVQGCEVGFKGAPKRGLLEEGGGVDYGGAKKSRVAPPQETSESNRASPLEALGSIPNSSNWRERINIGFCQDELDL
ncbi:hypothetical protein Adt_20672 [Abeliophyllum distichum]|uniref:Uncharacterized protein n=1 Tax=Abeliophyllum distichum TaxID=126358 RepID=A0ABD1SX59_9LAMI